MATRDITPRVTIGAARSWFGERPITNDDLDRLCRCKTEEGAKLLLQFWEGLAFESLKTSLRPLFGFGNVNSDNYAAALSMAGVFRDALALRHASENHIKTGKLAGKIAVERKEIENLLQASSNGLGAIGEDWPFPVMGYVAPLSEGYAAYLKAKIPYSDNSSDPYVADNHEVRELVVFGDSCADISATLFSIHASDVFMSMGQDGKLRLYPGCTAAALWIEAGIQLERFKVKICARCGWPFIARDRGNPGRYCDKNTCGRQARRKELSEEQGNGTEQTKGGEQK